MAQTDVLPGLQRHLITTFENEGPRRNRHGPSHFTEITPSDQFGRSGYRHRWHWNTRVPAQRIGHQVLLRVRRLFPRAFLAAVGRQTAHDGGQGAVGDALQVVDPRPGPTDTAE